MNLRVFTLYLLFRPIVSLPYLVKDQVLRIHSENVYKRNLLEAIINDPLLELDIWKDDMSEVDVRVPNSHLPTFKDRLKNFEYTVLIDDVQSMVEAEQMEFARRKKRDIQTEEELFSGYQDTDTLINYLSKLPGAQMFTLGYTYLDNPIQGVRIGTGSKNVVINGGIHAREWISPAVTAYVANYMLGSEMQAIDLRAKFTFHVIPVLNPDGYAYSRDAKGDRFWRKNREPNLNNPNCTGTDINRNFEYKWGNGDNECGEGYAGTAPLSTKEAMALDLYVKNLENVVAYIDVHSYSQLWLFPYGWTTEASPDSKNQMNASVRAVEAIERVHGTKFVAQQSSQLYITTGTANDHFYGLRNVKYSVAVELRDNGNYGFVLPASQIIPSGEEFTAGLVAFLEYVYIN